MRLIESTVPRRPATLPKTNRGNEIESQDSRFRGNDADGGKCSETVIVYFNRAWKVIER